MDCSFASRERENGGERERERVPDIDKWDPFFKMSVTSEKKRKKSKSSLRPLGLRNVVYMPAKKKHRCPVSHYRHPSPKQSYWCVWEIWCFVKRPNKILLPLFLLGGGGEFGDVDVKVHLVGEWRNDAAANDFIFPPLHSFLMAKIVPLNRKQVGA